MSNGSVRLPVGIGILVVYYLLYVAAYMVLRVEHKDLAGWVNLVVQASFSLLAVYFGSVLFKRRVGLLRAYFGFISLAALTGVLLECFYNYEINVQGLPIDERTAGAVANTLYVVYLALWCGAWTSLLVGAVASRKLGPRVAPTITFVAIALLGIFGASAAKMISLGALRTSIGNFHLVFTLLQFLAVAASVLAVLFLGITRILWIAGGFAIAIASDFALRPLELASESHPAHLAQLGWSLGQALIVLGLALPSELYNGDSRARLETSASGASASLIAYLATPVVLGTLVLVLLDNTFIRAGVAVSIIAGCATLVSIAVTQIDDASQSLRAQVRELFENGPNALLRAPGTLFRILGLDLALRTVGDQLQELLLTEALRPGR